MVFATCPFPHLARLFFSLLNAAPPPILNVICSCHFVQVVAVGFDPRMAKIALQHHRGDVEKAVEELVACGGIIDGEHCTDGRSYFSLYRLTLYSM